MLTSTEIKKRAYLEGKLMLPIQIGCPALIEVSDGYIRTSAVCAVASGRENELVIETMNSVYTLNQQDSISRECCQ